MEINLLLDNAKVFIQIYGMSKLMLGSRIKEMITKDEKSQTTRGEEEIFVLWRLIRKKTKTKKNKLKKMKKVHYI